VHKEFVPPGQTVNQAFYKDVLEWLRKRVQRVRTDIADDWVLQHENDFRYCYDQWKKRWNHCVTSQGSYFEGDNL
jgi:hypothetical protein